MSNEKIRNTFYVSVVQVWNSFDPPRKWTLGGTLALLIVLPLSALYIWLVFEVLFWIVTLL